MVIGYAFGVVVWLAALAGGIIASTVVALTVWSFVHWIFGEEFIFYPVVVTKAIIERIT